MKILFYIAKKYSIPIVRPLVQELGQRRIDHRFFVSRRVFGEMEQDTERSLLFTELDQAAAFQPDFVLVPGNFVDFRLPGIKVEIFHGIGIEKESHYAIRHFFDAYFTSGPCVTERFLKLQKRHKYFLVEETGWPKIDHIVQYPAAGLKKKLGIPEIKKIILYAPTFSKKMQSASGLFPHLPDIIGPDELCLIKFHDLMDKEIMRHFRETYSDRFRIIDDYDITPWLHVSDVLISDTSSVVYEFMVLDKPVITVNTQARTDKGIDIHDPERLRSALDRCFADPGEYRENRMRHLREVNPRTDGSVSAHMTDVLTDILENDRLPKKKKPLNLFRKLQLLSHEKFKKGYLR
ncbi:CDP-glycerol glycerophosphotransferase family protein [bacterium]|nr:CDP-glycerol glycerophosphotransferase family protein [bacterium]